MELLVPLLSFGGAFLAILFEMLGVSLDYHYPAFGCVIASCILAYLAWLRPRKDIVALSTPIYSFIFFVVPTDFSIGVVLQLLYAASLTILLIRMKYRFGSLAPQPGLARESGPLEAYAATVHRLLPDITPDQADHAGGVFIRFAQGEFEAAGRRAVSAVQVAGEGTSCADPVTCAYAIVAEQAEQTRAGGAVPKEFTSFGPDQYPLLVHPSDSDCDREQEYAAALDNALLLLYAIALKSEDPERKSSLDRLRNFALKLCGEL
jgi:hypothetical protein